MVDLLSSPQGRRAPIIRNRRDGYIQSRLLQIPLASLLFLSGYCSHMVYTALSGNSSVNEWADGSGMPIPRQQQVETGLEVFPILPLQSCVSYSNRPTEHLSLTRQTLHMTGIPPVSMKYLSGSTKDLKSDSLYAFENYAAGKGFEKAVTYLWISILSSLTKQSRGGDHERFMVIDGGMNTGFYTVLTAAMGYQVYSFELQLDCFDIVNMMLDGNGPEVRERARLFNIGIGEQVGTIEAEEGCNPGYTMLPNKTFEKPATVSWEKKLHQVAIAPLGEFLDQHRNGRDIALLKLDIEGAEVPALRGLGKHLDFVQNIIMEFAKTRSAAYTTIDSVRSEFERLKQAGFRVFKLFSLRIPRDKWQDDQHLKSIGLKTVQVHPILGSGVTTLGTDEATIMWEVLDWDRFFAKACPVGCNLWFTRI